MKLTWIVLAKFSLGHVTVVKLKSFRIAKLWQQKPTPEISLFAFLSEGWVFSVSVYENVFYHYGLFHHFSCSFSVWLQKQMTWYQWQPWHKTLGKVPKLAQKGRKRIRQAGIHSSAWFPNWCCQERGRRRNWTLVWNRKSHAELLQCRE